MIAQSVEGRLPDKELLGNRRYFKDFIDEPKAVGIVPVNRLLSRYRYCRLVRPDISDGIEPTRPLLESLRFDSRLNRPKVLGIDP